MSVGLRREQCILYIYRQNAVENARNHAVGLAHALCDDIPVVLRALRV